VAWAKALTAALRPGLRGLAPLLIHVNRLDEELPLEVPDIRSLLDSALRQQHPERPSDCQTVANTIFPQHYWLRSADRHELYQRYLKALPRIKRRNPANRHGLYFERMIRFGSGPQGGNQLEHLIDAWKHYNVRRPTAFQVNIFNPARDHTRQRRRGFPCLQHVCFTPLGRGKLAVMAVYPSQYLFERAYGNYLGLYRLGRFLAGELNLELSQLTCSVGIALPGESTRAAMRGLLDRVRPHLEQYEDQQAASAVAGGTHG
jgi:hypothetical protein